MTEVIITTLVLAVLFLICREVFCWYWKINALMGVLERIDAHLLDLKVPANGSSPSQVVKCPKCGRRIERGNIRVATNGMTQCPHCDGYFHLNG